MDKNLEHIATDTSWLAKSDTPTKEHVEALLGKIDEFCRARNWREGYFSKTAAGDVGVVKRLRMNGRVSASLMSRVERFLVENTSDPK